MRKLGKKYVEASNKVEKNKAYGVEEAVKLVKETSITKFDSSVEVAMNLNIDTKKSDQQLRGSIVLPNGTGKSKKILVLAKGAAAAEAKEAGYDTTEAYIEGEEIPDYYLEYTKAYALYPMVVDILVSAATVSE